MEKYHPLPSLVKEKEKERKICNSRENHCIMERGAIVPREEGLRGADTNP
jgi:hypothetical protein